MARNILPLLTCFTTHTEPLIGDLRLVPASSLTPETLLPPDAWRQRGEKYCLTPIYGSQAYSIETREAQAAAQGRPGPQGGGHPRLPGSSPAPQGARFGKCPWSARHRWVLCRPPTSRPGFRFPWRSPSASGLVRREDLPETPRPVEAPGTARHGAP